MSDHKEAPSEPRRGNAAPLDRRAFLRGLAIVAGGGVIAACSPGRRTPIPGAYRTPTLASALERSNPFTGTPETAISLEEFLAFSSLLTGVENLDPGLGQIYLQALEAGGGAGSSLAQVYSAASSGSNLPQDVEGLAGTGFFDEPANAELADAIITMWYTGTYQLDGEDRVATYVDALAWKVLTFTKPPTLCGTFGFWSQEPIAQISPQIQYTPVPTPAQGQ